MVEERGFKKLTMMAEHVAELPYTPSQTTGKNRLIVLRQRNRVGEGRSRQKSVSIG